MASIGIYVLSENIIPAEFSFLFCEEKSLLYNIEDVMCLKSSYVQIIKPDI